MEIKMKFNFLLCFAWLYLEMLKWARENGCSEKKNENEK